MSLLEVEDLSVSFGGQATVKNISFRINEGEMFALVGESGCGKTTVGRAITGLYKAQGSVIFKGEDITGKGCAGGIQMIFQDPLASLDPRMTVKEIISEGIKLSGKKGDVDALVRRSLTRVGISPQTAGRYPHRFSGGQRQRICIARAVAAEPELIIADEPISALDVSLQAQVMDLLNRLSREMDIAILFISHDLAVVRKFCRSVAVMHAGRIVELAPSEELFEHPLHRYTQSLLSNVLYPDPIAQRGRVPVYYEDDELAHGADSEFCEVTDGHFVLCEK